MTDRESSGSHRARKRLVNPAELSPGFRAPQRGREEVVIVQEPPEPPHPVRDVLGSLLKAAVGGGIGGAVAIGIAWGTITAEVDQLRKDVDEQIVEARSDRADAREERRRLGGRVGALEVDAARRGEATDALRRAVEDLTQEVRLLRRGR